MKPRCRLFLTAMFLTLAPVLTQAQALRLPHYSRVRLDNGLTLLLMEHREVPLVSLSLIIKTGSTADPVGKEGVASLAAALLRKGTLSRSADRISSELDYMGGQLGAATQPDYTEIGAEFMKKDLDKGLELFADVVLHPTFPQDEVTKMTRQRIDGIRSAKDQATAVIGNYFATYFYGGHPYGRPTGGDENSLGTVSREDVARFFRTCYVPSNAILAVVGDFSAAEMRQRLTDVFGTWAPGSAPTVSLPEPSPVRGRRLLLVEKPDTTQTFYQIGNLGISRTNPDRVYIQVVNALFGGRFTSMLNSELRVNSGLTYGAGSRFAEHKARGVFTIGSYTANATTEKALDVTLEVVRRLHEKGVSEDQLKSAKAYLKGQFPPEIETSDQLASLISELEFYGLDSAEIDNYYTRIDAMTVADAQRIIKQYFPLDDLVFVLIGRADVVSPIASKYASQVERKSITSSGF